MEFKFNMSFKTHLDPKDPNNANAIRYIEEYGMENYLKHLQGYVLVAMEAEMQMLFANQLQDFAVEIETKDVKLFQNDRNDIMRSAF